MENLEKKLSLARNFLFKWFIVGFLLMTISGLLYILAKDWAADIVTSWYGISPETYYNIAMWFFTLAKLFLILMVLAPAIALHWLISCCKKQNGGCCGCK